MTSHREDKPTVPADAVEYLRRAIAVHVKDVEVENIPPARVIEIVRAAIAFVKGVPAKRPTTAAQAAVLPRPWRVKDEQGDDLITLWKRRPPASDEYAAAEIIEQLEQELAEAPYGWLRKCPPGTCRVVQGKECPCVVPAAEPSSTGAPQAAETKAAPSLCPCGFAWPDCVPTEPQCRQREASNAAALDAAAPTEAK